MSLWGIWGGLKSTVGPGRGAGKALSGMGGDPSEGPGDGIPGVGTRAEVSPAPTDIAYLRSVLPSTTEDAFFDYLCTVDASEVTLSSVPEGSVVFSRVGPGLSLAGGTGARQQTGLGHVPTSPKAQAGRCHPRCPRRSRSCR